MRSYIYIFISSYSEFLIWQLSISLLGRKQLEVSNLYQGVIDVIRKEVIRLISEQLHSIFEPLLQTPDFFKKPDQHRNLSYDLIQQWINSIRGEAYKVKRFEVAFVVVGTMKAGKSTAINAIVGTELLPNRNQPMTILPTIIRHCSGKKEPDLTFPNPQPFNELIGKLCEKLREKQKYGELDQLSSYATSDGKELIHKMLNGSLLDIHSSYKGTEEIFQFLKYVNDIWRLCSTDDIALDSDKYLYSYHSMQELPTIEVEFFHLRDQDYAGKFSLIDTPGPNEAGQACLKYIMEEQLQNSSAIIVILDYTQINAEAEAKIRESLNQLTQIAQNRLFVLVNKFDQKDRNGMDLETLQSYVATHLFEGRVNKKRVFPVSSKYAYLANRALYELFVHGKLSDYRFNPWIEDFGQLALGTCWESEIDDIAEVKNRATKLWQKSLFDLPLTEVVKNGSENAAIMSLRSAIAKMLDYDKQIIENIQFRLNALTTDIEVIENHIQSLEEDIDIIKNAHADLRMIIDKSIYNLQEKTYKMFDESEKSLTKKIQTMFYNNKEESWLVKRLKKYVGKAAQDIDTVALAESYNDFATEEAAWNFLEKLIEVVLSTLHQMQQKAKVNVDDVLENIWTKVNSRLEPILTTAEERLYESFSVLVDFPKPKVQTVFDLDRKLHSSIREDSITKTGTKRERRWYTLWSREHEITYQYQEQVYRIYTKDVLEQLQKILKTDSNGIWTSLDLYVRTEFTEAINTYFAELFDYLARLKGDLVDSKHDQKLESEHIEKLQMAMSELLRIATAHQKDAQSLGKGFLIKCKVEQAAG